MAQRAIIKPPAWSPPAQERSSPFAPRPFVAPAPREEPENADFHRDKLEAFDLQRKEKGGTLTPVDQDRLGVLQAKMDRFWAERSGAKDDLPRQLLVPASPGSNDGIVQRVRTNVAPPGLPINVANLEERIVVIDEQIRSLEEENAEEAQLGFIDFGRIRGWREALNGQMERLRAADDGGSYSQDEVMSRADEKLQAYHAALVTCANLRNGLNTSLKDYTEYQEGQKHREGYKELRDKKVEAREKKKEKEKEVEEPRKTPTSRGPIGLEGKWGPYGKELKWKGQTEFHQHVPEQSATIARCLKSQNLSDAVYHTDKAFWVADPRKYKLSSAAGKALMVYKFTSEGAKSLMEDYLICGSGDFADDNEEVWTGETAHPDYTIWKANEVGAYGIGANRLKQLQAGLASIKAFDSRGRPISA